MKVEARGPKGERASADAIRQRRQDRKIATGDLKDVATKDGKKAATVVLACVGGKART